MLQSLIMNGSSQLLYTVKHATNLQHLWKYFFSATVLNRQLLLFKRLKHICLERVIWNSIFGQLSKLSIYCQLCTQDSRNAILVLKYGRYNVVEKEYLQFEVQWIKRNFTQISYKKTCCCQLSNQGTYSILWAFN